LTFLSFLDIIIPEPTETRLKKQVVLKRNEEKRILSGHQWVFSNEVKEARGSPCVGDLVELTRHDGKFLGLGFYNPHSLIAFRFLTSEREEISFDFFKRRILQAYGLRKRLYPRSAVCRLVHGESDYLPGLIVDKYGDYLSLQTHSFGMDNRLTLICDVLESIFQPAGIAERNESQLRGLEGLPERKGVLRGKLEPYILAEHDIQYEIDLLEGQKTGFYLDQRENRKAIRRFSNGAAVLDCFCNDGGFGFNAAAAEAASVLGIDISESVVRRAERNALVNKFGKTCHIESADVFDVLKDFVQKKKTFDMIVLDPPSFTRSKKNLPTAKKGYKEINTNAISLLKEGGVLATSSCSHHVSEEGFVDILNESATIAGRKIQLIEWRGAAPDHPVLPSMPETKYLKFGIFIAQ
jgi:23S rRNA (cytosine1962-C5)-methyltransferase